MRITLLNLTRSVNDFILDHDRTETVSASFVRPHLRHDEVDRVDDVAVTVGADLSTIAMCGIGGDG
jgi:hypothetical protein